MGILVQRRRRGGVCGEVLEEDFLSFRLGGGGGRRESVDRRRTQGRVCNNHGRKKIRRRLLKRLARTIPHDRGV
jgi:hypothetical protein